MEHNSGAFIYQTTPSGTKNSVLTTHTQKFSGMKEKQMLRKSTKKSTSQSVVIKFPVSAGWKSKDLHDSLLLQTVKLFTSADELPKTIDTVLKVNNVTKFFC